MSRLISADGSAATDEAGMARRTNRLMSAKRSKVFMSNLDSRKGLSKNTAPDEKLQHEDSATAMLGKRFYVMHIEFKS
jgi:hypothetical protein